jgi:sirohydrochlorin cobaltochelatase
MNSTKYENQSFQERRAILLVGFGGLAVLADEFRQAFPGSPVITARTLEDGLAQCRESNVFVQPVYLLPGIEFERLQGKAADIGGGASCGEPLLSTPQNLQKLAKILKDEYAGQAVLFAGHGSHHAAGRLYAELAVALKAAGLMRSFVGVLEGEPEFRSAVDALLQSGTRQVSLVPLMLTLGMHAKIQILGENEESWNKRLQSLGFSVNSVARSLLDFPAVRRLFLESARERLGE